MFKWFKNRPKEEVKEPTYTMGLYANGKQLNYKGYKRQRVDLEMLFQEDEIRVINTNAIKFKNIKYNGSALMSIIFDKNGEELLFFKISQNVIFIRW